MKEKISVVIPCYKVTKFISAVITTIPETIWRIYIIDDACPEKSGEFVEKNFSDPRIHVIYHQKNQGVGGAVMTGYWAALNDGADIIVKIDGDGQMEPRLIPKFISPIVEGHADYVKGNRFYDLTTIKQMPLLRLFGNTFLSFFTKLSSGYWHIFDPTNGYTAINAKVAVHLPTEKISKRFFFESDMLFRLNLLRAVVVDIPMEAIYQYESSNLSITRVSLEFIFKNFRNFHKRIFYNYFLRDMNIASIELIAGLFLFIFGFIFGSIHWIDSYNNNKAAPTGTIMIAVICLLIGIQFILAFLGFDIANIPTKPIGKSLPDKEPEIKK